MLIRYKYRTPALIHFKHKIILRWTEDDSTSMHTVQFEAALECSNSFGIMY